MTEFIAYVAQLHTEKHNVYGDSWKRRGEAVAILANIARKVDRLGVAGAGDTSADTAVDLLVYLAKYRLWLHDERGEMLHPFSVNIKLGDGPQPVEDLMLRKLSYKTSLPTSELVQLDKELFEKLVTASEDNKARSPIVMSMLHLTAPLAFRLWAREQ